LSISGFVVDFLLSAVDVEGADFKNAVLLVALKSKWPFSCPAFSIDPVAGYRLIALIIRPIVDVIVASESELAKKLLQERSERTIPSRSANESLHVELGLNLLKIIELVRILHES